MSIYAIGSVTYDHILFYEDEFPVPPSVERGLNFSIVTDRMVVGRGGTATGICYNLNLLGLSSGVVSAVGKDDEGYFEWFKERGISTDGLVKVEDAATAKAFIATDRRENQVSIFYPGALAGIGGLYGSFDWDRVSLAVISAGSPGGLRLALGECLKRSIRYIYNPGQTLTELTADDVVRGVTGASAIVLNELELAQVVEKTGLQEVEIARIVPLLVVTLGANGSRLRRGSETVAISAVAPTKCLDPTGAGDAYCAGLVKGFVEERSLIAIGRLATLAATYAVECFGVVEHNYSWPEFCLRFYDEYCEMP